MNFCESSLINEMNGNEAQGLYIDVEHESDLTGVYLSFSFTEQRSRPWLNRPWPGMLLEENKQGVIVMFTPVEAESQFPGGSGGVGFMAFIAFH